MDKRSNVCDVFCKEAMNRKENYIQMMINHLISRCVLKIVLSPLDDTLNYR